MILAGARCTALLVVVSMLPGCGFHLRGDVELPDGLEPVHIEYAINTRFAKALKEAMLRRGLQVVATPGSASAQLRIIKDESGQRILSVAVTEGPEEYEVYQVVTISLIADGKALIEPSTFTLTRDYTYDKTNILGKRGEYESLRDALAVAMAETVLRRISYVQPPATQ
ncbi:MAG: hypothetical protein HKN70_06920 [Gammaproteobacteria bacterium]|nr:hypothetical protein [Gammaproteobacteria bacterium]